MSVLKFSVGILCFVIVALILILGLGEGNRVIPPVMIFATLGIGSIAISGVWRKLHGGNRTAGV